MMPNTDAKQYLYDERVDHEITVVSSHNQVYVNPAITQILAHTEAIL